MAPALTQTELYQPKFPVHFSKSPVSSDFVDLPLLQDESHLLHAVRSQYQDFLGPELANTLDVAAVLNICWILTVRSFSPTRVMYLDLHPASGLCHINDTFQPGASVSPLQVNPEDSVKDLVGDFGLIQSGLKVMQPGEGDLAPEGQKGFFTSAVHHAGEQSVLPEASTLVKLGPSSLKLVLVITKRNGKLHARLAFSPLNITKALATSILHTFGQALASVHQSPLQSLETLNLCSKHDIGLIHGYTSEVSESCEALLHDMALEHARLTPDAPAVCSWDGNLTYRELDDLTSRLGHFLANLGVRPETYVLSCFEKSTWAIVARLAIMKAGGAYISVDATDPPLFLGSIISRVNAKIMLTSPAYMSDFTPMLPTVIPITPTMLQNLPIATKTICSNVKPNNACLILFTSGSTGQPKGIIQEHRSYATAVKDYNQAIGLDRHSRVFQFDDFAFDIGNNDYLTTLIAGGCCCVPTPEKTIPNLIETFNAMKVNASFMTPTIAIQLAPSDVPTLELLCVGGEPMSNDLLLKWGPYVKLINQYGMGEAATFCAYNISPEPGQNAVVGHSGSGAIWITNPVSPELPAPVGVVGEILIEGPHLSRGYLDSFCLKPDVGFLQFTPQWIADLHPSRAATSRIYRSGDLGRYLHDGTVEHMGRKDTLLKLNGGRVESTEVEHVVRKTLSREDFVVVDLLGEIDGIEEPALVAFLYLAENPMNLSPTAPNDTMSFVPITKLYRANALVEEICAEIMATLPVYMVPSLFLLVDTIPRTRSNKTDRRKLHQIAQKWYMSNRALYTQ